METSETVLQTLMAADLTTYSHIWEKPQQRKPNASIPLLLITSADLATVAMLQHGEISLQLQ